MTRRIPRLEVIEAFIEAAGAPTFRIAAERCALSPAAFSRRIQAFSAFVGREVFQRHPGGMRLTEAGRECFDALEPIYRDMTSTALELGPRRAARKVTVSLSHSLSVAWLMPRLDAFRRRRPDLEIVILTTRTSEAVRGGAADLGVCSKNVPMADLHTEPFLDVNVTPLAAPAVAAAVRSGERPLHKHRLLGPSQDPGIWGWWSEVAKPDEPPLRTTDTFDMAYALYEAAAAGWGVAAGMDVTAAAHMASGRLVSLGLPSVRWAGGYHLVGRPRRLRDAAVTEVWDWLREEGERDRRIADTTVADLHA